MSVRHLIHIRQRTPLLYRLISLTWFSVNKISDWKARHVIMCQNGAGFSTNARKLGQVPNRFEFNMAVHVYVDRVWLVLYIYIYMYVCIWITQNHYELWTTARCCGGAEIHHNHAVPCKTGLSRPHFYQTRSAWSVDQGSNKNHSPAYNFAPTVTKFCVMWEGLSLPHDTKFGNCRCKIVDSRSFPSWSLIHGLRWSGLIKVGPEAHSAPSIPCAFIQKQFTRN